jgi:transposase
MKMREIVLRAIAKKITWDQAADVLGISNSSMDRLRRLYERRGYDGFWVRARRQKRFPPVPLATVEKILLLYQEKYPHLDTHSFCQKLSKRHGVHLSHDFVDQVLCDAGLVARPHNHSNAPV